MQPTIEFIIDLCRQAGKVLRDGYGKKHAVEYKGPIDPVTEIDRRAEDLIIRAIRSRYPGHSIEAEESGITSGEKEHGWIIDPVDGTANYAKGLPFFCVSVAYAQNGKVQKACAYDPLRDEFFYASRGEGAFLNKKPIRVSTTSELISSMLVTGFPYDHAKLDENLAHFTRLLRKVQTIRRLGSAVLDQVYVAAGRIDGYWQTGVKPWDIAGGTLIIEEAGGVITNLKGEPDYMRPPYDIVAANPKLHPILLAELRVNHPG